MLRQKGGGGMELRVLKYFLVVAREENITKAAAFAPCDPAHPIPPVDGAGGGAGREALSPR